MFRGRYEHTMTDKGRISVPSKFREVLKEKYDDETLVITNFDKCLAAYPVKEWNEIEKKAAELPQFRQEVISFLRYLMGSAIDCQIDGSGRVLIPQALRNHAQIKRDVVMIGMLSRFEIWSRELWEEEESKKAYEEFKRSREILAGQRL
ncbi:MAG TPA: division/cell wall cluster transcriptional repressor MraZ [Thermodesulfobacteriota bacterium]|jgi:MraZ protein|nr:division/cell wall cluster transcriptional repressor MraZ [Thermodesulfobacteriota bacterium]